MTNKHVLCDITHFKLVFTINNSTKEIMFTVGNDVRMHATYDLAVIKFDQARKEMLKQGITPFLGIVGYDALISDFSTYQNIEDIIMIGYPDGLINYNDNMPIVRKGTTATSICHLYNGLEIFITDLPTFGGSSGSPIFKIVEDEIFLVGQL